MTKTFADLKAGDKVWVVTDTAIEEVTIMAKTITELINAELFRLRVKNDDKLSRGDKTMTFSNVENDCTFMHIWSNKDLSPIYCFFNFEDGVEHLRKKKGY